MHDCINTTSAQTYTSDPVMEAFLDDAVTAHTFRVHVLDACDAACTHTQAMRSLIDEQNDLISMQDRLILEMRRINDALEGKMGHMESVISSQKTIIETQRGIIEASLGAPQPAQRRASSRPKRAPHRLSP